MSDYTWNESLNQLVRKGSFMDQAYGAMVKYCPDCTRKIDNDGMPCMISLEPAATTNDRDKRMVLCLDCRASSGYAESDISDPPF